MNKLQSVAVAYCGIDPGLSGALAALDNAGTLIDVFDAPVIRVKKSGGGFKTVYLPGEAVNRLRILFESNPTYRFQVILEQVSARPGQGVTSMFSMGRGVGMWEGIIAALGLPLEYVVPQVWKKEFQLTGPLGKDKGASVRAAHRIVPSCSPHLTLVKHHGRAEAILLAEYLRRRSTR